MELQSKFPAIVLASGSPRRRHLLSELGLKFDLFSPDIDEVYPEDLPALEVAPYLSKLKSSAIAPIEKNTLYITCDTTVCMNNLVINKPKDELDAIEMLTVLSGKTHTVVSGITLIYNHLSLTFSEKTDVHFFPLRRSEIEHYVRNFQPLDKAGSYGIQEWIGYIGVKEIRGCFYNVMGLPVSALYQVLLSWDIH